jgi:hypothetical protein
MPGKVPQRPNIKKKGKSIKEKRAAKKQKSAGGGGLTGGISHPA